MNRSDYVQVKLFEIITKQPPMLLQLASASFETIQMHVSMWYGEIAAAYEVGVYFVQDHNVSSAGIWRLGQHEKLTDVELATHIEVFNGHLKSEAKSIRSKRVLDLNTQQGGTKHE